MTSILFQQRAVAYSCPPHQLNGEARKLEAFSGFGENKIGNLEILSEGGGLVFARGWHEGAGGERNDVLILLPSSDLPAPTTLDRLAHEYSFKEVLDATWAVRPLELVSYRGRSIL